MDAAALAHALGATRSGRQWKCKCIAHEDRSPSMIIFDGHQSVQVRCLAGCEPIDIIAELRRRGLWERDGGTMQERAEQRRPPIVSHETAMRDRARALFDASMLTIGTPAESYLEDRDIWSVAKEIEDIRFHPGCPRGDERRPAIVVAMRYCSWLRPIYAVQRIYLKRVSPGYWVKDGKPMMLGPVRDSAMMLDRPVGELHIAEGLETALSVMAMGHDPVWAMGSCGAIERLKVLDGIDHLVIWADNDAPGLAAANACARRWADAGCQDVRLRIPNREGFDFNDVWMARNARQ